MDDRQFIDSELSFKECFVLYKKAECLIKTIEHQDYDNFIRGTYIPAINDLRYAGRHILEAIDSSNPSKIKENLDEAIDHCNRAIYDAYEIGILLFSNQFKIISDNFKHLNLSTELNFWIELQKILIDSSNYINTTNKSTMAKEKFTTVESFYNELKDYYDKFLLNKETLISSENKKVQHNIEILARGLLFGPSIALVLFLIFVLLSNYILR